MNKQVNYKIRQYCTLIAACVLFILSASGCREVSAPRLPEPAYRVEAWNQDLAYLLNDYPKYNKSFTRESSRRSGTNAHGG